MRPCAAEKEAAEQEVLSPPADEPARLRAEAAAWRARVPKLVAALEERSRALQERSRALEEAGQALDERDRALGARDRELARRAAAIARLEAELAAQAARNARLQETLGLAERQIAALGDDLDWLAGALRAAEARANAPFDGLAAAVDVAPRGLHPNPHPDRYPDSRLDPPAPQPAIVAAPAEVAGEVEVAVGNPVTAEAETARATLDTHVPPPADTRATSAIAAEIAPNSHAVGAAEADGDTRVPLTRVRGIGVRTAERLAAAGIQTLAALAALDLASLADPDHALHDLRGRARRDDWIGQAGCMSGSITHVTQQ